MARRGPAPEPTALKRLKGNPGKRALTDNYNEPKPRAGAPSCPSDLSPAAKTEWRRMTKELLALGLLTHVDRACLAVYCALYARWMEAEAQIQKHGVLIKSPSGYPMQSPYLDIASSCIKQMRGYLQEFGLSPSARTRIRIENPNASKGDAWDDLARRRERRYG